MSSPSPSPYNIKISAMASEINKFPAKQNAHSVLRYLKAKDGLLCLPGSGLPNWDDSDQPKPFRQLRYFYYLSGCNEPDCYLTYDVSRDFLTLYIAPIVPSRVIWNGRGSTIEEAQSQYDVDEVKFTSSLLKDYGIWARANSHSTVYFLHPTPDPFLPHLSPYTSSSSPNIDTSCLLPAMNAARTIKSPYEISLIRHANSISTKAHIAVLRSLKYLTNESEIEGLFLKTCISNGAKEQAYEIIAGSGPNAAILHYVKNDESLKGRQLVCLDAGAEYLNYASDVTRTFPITGHWTKAAKSIYDIVQEMQDECISRIKPGVRFLDLYYLAAAIALPGLMDLGILHNGTESEIAASNAVSMFFPHGLGHHLGLEVHDVSAVPILSATSPQETSSTGPVSESVVKDSPSCPPPPPPPPPLTLAPTPSQQQAPQPLYSHLLEPNMVLTVEPGIYFSQYAFEFYESTGDPRMKYVNMDIVKQYYEVGGVRIEDDILVTDSSYENITTAPKGEEMLRLIREGWEMEVPEDTIVKGWEYRPWMTMFSAPICKP